MQRAEGLRWLAAGLHIRLAARDVKDRVPALDASRGYPLDSWRLSLVTAGWVGHEQPMWPEIAPCGCVLDGVCVY